MGNDVGLGVGRLAGGVGEFVVGPTTGAEVLVGANVGLGVSGE